MRTKPLFCFFLVPKVMGLCTEKGLVKMQNFVKSKNNFCFFALTPIGLAKKPTLLFGTWNLR